MKIKPDKDRTTKDVPNNTPKESPRQVLRFPKRRARDPFPEFPSQMVVALDGWTGIDKERAGAWVARAIGGVLVDSGLFYRALLDGCHGCGVDLRDAAAVEDFCKRVSLKNRFQIGDWAPVPEAVPGINDRWYSKAGLQGKAHPGAASPAFLPIRSKVCEFLTTVQPSGRVVILGRDIGHSLFPRTPYKFFFHTTHGLRDENSPESITYPGVVRPHRGEHYFMVRTWNDFKILMIDAARILASETGGLIVAECVLRATERGEYREKS